MGFSENINISFHEQKCDLKTLFARWYLLFGSSLFSRVGVNINVVQEVEDGLDCLFADSNPKQQINVEIKEETSEGNNIFSQRGGGGFFKI